MSLALALLLDALLGEPPWLWRRLPHPVVLMGRLIGWLDDRFNHGPRRQFKGLATLACLLAVGAASGFALQQLGMVAEILIAAILLAQRSLVDHVQAVATALRIGLPEGRIAVARIVGRDPASLDEAGCGRAAIESAAENFSDGVVAPAFWFLLLGLPGIITYKLVNTADSMIGYKSERYRDFGRAAARFDDLINYPAARLSALLIALAAGRPAILRLVPAEAAKHASPNAGWPEAATALTMNYALAGPRRYAHGMSEDAIINESGRRELNADDIQATLALIWRAWGLLLALAVIIALLAG